MKRLSPGKKIGIISPSWNGPGLFPHVFQKGISEVERLFKADVTYSKHCIQESMPSPQERAQDIHDMFLAQDVELIISSIGGNDSLKVIPFLDENVLRRSAGTKIFMGYSDSTTLLLFFQKLGIQTIHGPSIMSGFAEMDGVKPELEKHILDIFSGQTQDYEYPMFERSVFKDSPWEDEEKFFASKVNYDVINNWHILREGTASGFLYGGNIETIVKMSEAGLLEELAKDWADPILFLETSEEKPSLDYLIHCFDDETLKKTILRSKALLFGYLSYYSEEEKAQIRELIRDVLARTGYSGVVVSDMYFGHSRPQWLLLEGKEYALDTQSQKLILR